ncbi:uncharacterized protein PV06_11793 [Exophiala oligosperma]|uniref:C2H2-type domain-containing protein n=1 Tax=Exophiala oligosperma TaxID=215243 RepID=A0A0D2D0X5_9EURO|nr:uncharacterized protein PV06_11793 [Exophiala oligosperma]KIW35890.1 hypothetical protein PV06_11793 [Exophiala oligosperma]
MSPTAQVYSFMPVSGNPQHKRPRQGYEEIDRLYKCGWNGCEKTYGTLNHLNAHVNTQSHGTKITPEEFKETRKKCKARKMEEEERRRQVVAEACKLTMQLEMQTELRSQVMNGTETDLRFLLSTLNVQTDKLRGEIVNIKAECSTHMKMGGWAAMLTISVVYMAHMVRSTGSVKVKASGYLMALAQCLFVFPID